MNFMNQLFLAFESKIKNILHPTQHETNFFAAFDTFFVQPKQFLPPVSIQRELYGYLPKYLGPMNTTDIKRKDYGAANFTYDEDWNLLLLKKSGNERISFCIIIL